MNVLKPFKNQEAIIRINSPLIEIILSALSSRNYAIFEKHLCKNGEFFNYSKTVFISKLKNILNVFENYSCEYIYGNSTGILPGEVVHQFIYTKKEEFSDEIKLNQERYPGYNLNKKLKQNQIRIRMIFTIHNGQIIKISKPNKFINLKELKKAQLNN